MADEARIEELGAALAPLGELRARPMFGGAGLSLDGVFFGLFFGGELWLKADERTLPAFERAGARRFRPPGRPAGRGPGYWSVPLEVEEDARALRAWAKAALGAARRRDAARPARKRKTRSPAKSSARHRRKP